MAAVQQNPAALEHVDVTLRPDTWQQDAAGLSAKRVWRFLNPKRRCFSVGVPLK
jgi:hypothetical protein